MKRKVRPAVILDGNQNPAATERLLKDRRVSVIVKDFHGVDWWKQTKVFPNFAVTYNPGDFPGKYCARLFDGQQPTRLVAVKETLEEIRATIPPHFLRVPRQRNDDPVIIETWL